MNLYISGIGWLAILIIYIPITILVVWLLYLFVLKKLKVPVRIFCIAGLFMCSATLLLWDVIQIGNQAKELCKNAGLHINKSVAADGFFGKGAAGFTQTWKPYGFNYVEEKELSGKFVQYSELNGELVKEKIEQPKSNYWSIQDNRTIGKHFNEVKTIIKDIRSGEILGDLTYYKIYPGWFDSFILGASGFSFSPWVCREKNEIGKNISRSQLIKGVIKPRL